jgi:hypothetical protein
VTLTETHGGRPILDRLFLVIGLVMLFDLAFFGAGILIPGLGTSLRRVLFVALLGVATLRRLAQSRTFTASEASLVLLIMTLTAVWTVVLPASYGFSSAAAFAEVSPWLGLIMLALWPWDAWPEVRQWRRFQRYVIVLSLGLALFHIVLALIIIIGLVPAGLMLTAFDLIPTPLGADGGFLNIAELPNGLVRIYYSSSVFMLFGMYFLIAHRPPRLTRRWVLAIVIIGAGLFVTYIRSFLAVVAMTVLLQQFLRFLGPDHAVSPRLKVLALWILGVAMVCVAIDPSVLSALQLSRDVSDDERVDQAEALLAQFANHPLLGTGFGSYATQHVRASELPGAYELEFHALLMKLGIVGMLLLITILGVCLSVSGISSHARANPRQFSSWAAFTTGFWFAGATNPHVTNFIGMSMILLLLVDVRYWGSEDPPAKAAPELSATPAVPVMR